MKPLAVTANLKLRFALLLASFGFFLASIFSVSLAEAVSDQWRILPGLNATGIYNYGWHFNEGSYAWHGARDINHANDSGMTVYVRAEALQNISWPIRYKLTKIGFCTVHAEAQLGSGGGWTTLPSSSLHYLHIIPSFSGTIYTSSMQAYLTTISKSIGTVAPIGHSCVSGSPHLHQSGDLSSSSYNYRYKYAGTEDTCWASSDIYCNAFTWDRKHVSCVSSPYYSIGSYARTGTAEAGTYVCAEWPNFTISPGWRVFTIKW